MKKLDRTFCIAPMMNWSDRHCRYFWRLLTKKALVYTEMITTGALRFGNITDLLKYDSFEHPIGIQLGGNDPSELAFCAALCEKYGFDEINLNVGCPSERVKSGCFGASLMNEPLLVSDCIKAIKDEVNVPVTIKCRIGIDNNDSYSALADFIGINDNAGCDAFIIHARKAWLKGLSPKQNREIPPLNYPRVLNIKKDFPQQEIILNGGLKSISECKEYLNNIDGVMLGREVYQNPYMLSMVDKYFYGDNKKNNLSPINIAYEFSNYIEKQLSMGVKLNSMTRHILGLFKGSPNSKKFRRFLSENAHKNDADITTYHNALNIMN